MPEIMKDPVTFSSRGRNSAQPWAQWFTEYAGQVVKFTTPADFSIKPRSFAVAAQEYAKAQTLGRVQTSVTEDAVILKFPSAAENAIAADVATQVADQIAIDV